MAMIKKDGNFMGLPMNIARGNPIPLDKSEIWYSYEEMLSYAATNPVAYVGQILGLVDEENNTAKAYIILNTDGEVQEVGKATVVDNTTIILDNDDTLSLKDFGKKYYAYVAEKDNVAAHYIEQTVDEEHPWFSGLEPRVVLEGTQFVLGWFEPNPTTMEGVNSSIAGIQTSVNTLTTTTANLSERLNNTYTKSETDSAIAEKVAAAAHLKRKKVDFISDIDPSASDAEQYIYMIPIGITENDNKYAEYIVIDGAVEPVGTWEVNLEEYATKAFIEDNFIKIDSQKDLVNKADIEKLATISENAEKNIINLVSENFTIDAADRKLELVSIPTTINLSTNTSLLDTFVQVDSSKSLVSNTEIAKLFTVSEYAEKNIINTVDETQFNIDDDRKLTLISVDGSIIDLNSNTDFNNVTIDLISVQDDISSISNKIQNLNISLTDLGNQFGNYVTKTDYKNDMDGVWERLTWHEL